MAGELADAELEPAHEGGLTTSEAERSLNEEEEDVEGGEAGEPLVDPAVEEQTALDPAMEEQKAGEA
jgi:hypothetical protein